MLQVETKDKIAVAKMSHGKANALDLELCQALTHQFRTLAKDQDSNAVVFGSAGRIFSGGVDLVRLVAEPPEYTRLFFPALIELFETLFEFPKPMVAAINGSAVAGGCVIASASDYRLIVPKAKIGIPELRVGVPLPVLGMEIMRSVSSPATFQNMVNIGSTWSGNDAVDVGLADQVAEPEEIFESAVAKAIELTQIPTNVFALSKRQLRKPVRDRIAVARKEFDAEIDAIWYSDEIRIVIKDYVEHRLKKRS